LLVKEKWGYQLTGRETLWYRPSFCGWSSARIILQLPAQHPRPAGCDGTCTPRGVVVLAHS